MSDADAGSQHYREVNRQGWDNLVRHGCPYTRPVTREDFPWARASLVPEDWVDWGRIDSMLCLASGGGQQGPLAASLGKRVTVADLSPAQLEQDRRTASALGLQLETIEVDMQDLAALYGRRFDLVYQPVSACYIPDVRRVYREVARVIAPGGLYAVTHWNPTLTQMPDSGSWDGSAYRLVTPQMTGKPIQQTKWSIAGREHDVTTWAYLHPLADLIGGILDAGFTLLRFSEEGKQDLAAAPGSLEHVAAYAPPMLRMLARSPM